MALPVFQVVSSILNFAKNPKGLFLFVSHYEQILKIPDKVAVFFAKYHDGDVTKTAIRTKILL